MSELLLEPFLSNEFMVRALIVGLLTVVTTSVVGTWVVLRGLGFLGDALAHGVLPGIAIAFVLGVNPMIGAAFAALVMITTINSIRSHTSLPEDTSIGILFVGFLALAVVIMSSASGAFVGDLNRFLFGSITGISDNDLIVQGVAALIALIGVAVLYRPLLTSTFDENHAALAGFNPRLTHFLLLALLALAIVASFGTVGNLLVFGFLVAPPATASLIARQVPRIMMTSVVIGFVSVIAGLLVSFHYRTAASATMALVSVSIFLVVLTADSLSQRIRSLVSQPVSPSV